MLKYVCFALGVGLLAAEVRPLIHMEGHGIRQQIFVGAVTDSEFRRLAEKVLQPPDVTLGVVSAYPTNQDRVLAGPRETDHCGYQSWRALLKSNANRTGKCAEIREAIKLGSATVIRTRNSECRIRNEVTMGQGNPLSIVEDGIAFEVLSVALSRPLAEEKRHLISAEVFVLSQMPASQKLARLVTARIRNVTNARYLTVVLRSDRWFINECGFPGEYPFAQADIPIDLPAFAKTRYAVCSVSGDWPMNCFESTSAQ